MHNIIALYVYIAILRIYRLLLICMYNVQSTCLMLKYFQQKEYHNIVKLFIINSAPTECIYYKYIFNAAMQVYIKLYKCKT